MELNEILAITGAAGLYKFVAQGKGGIIVESLSDKRRTMVSGSAKVSALGDIAIFTDSGETPLGELMQQIYDTNSGKAIEINHKTASPEELHSFMSSALPNYDADRVHNSDIKKIIQWFNILVAAGMSSFLPKEEQQAEVATETEVSEAETKKPAKAAKPKATASTAAAKKSTTAAKQATPKAAGSKAASSRSTTARKAQ